MEVSILERSHVVVAFLGVPNTTTRFGKICQSKQPLRHLLGGNWEQFLSTFTSVTADLSESEIVRGFTIQGLDCIVCFCEMAKPARGKAVSFTGPSRKHGYRIMA
eukprot:1972417-Rhodomonas_salina.2